MDRASDFQVFAYSLLAVIVFFFPPAICEEFNYDLLSPNGPFNWGNKPGWHLCKNGTRQSPINLQKLTANLIFDSGIERNYQPANATLISTEHDIMVNWTENAGFITVNGTQYQLVQCHWHSPSEHTINGIRYDLELHMVHRSSDARLAVTGIVYKFGRPDQFISTIEEDLQLMAQNQSRRRELGIVDPEEVAGITGNKYFRYNGSLTVPPCHQNVLWTVFIKEGRTASREQIKLLRRAVNGAGDETFTNSRPLQPRNNRLVQLYKDV
ncbi:hypothetical protein VNO78_14124 [Psophocarpus tetragonolobus]|uniref:Carbonic anhydrase n=1 Tax=Psophocarpus tetragonolobus TaxID=3891 RepID=A0AAN9XQV9_PSOTE